MLLSLMKKHGSLKICQKNKKQKIGISDVVFLFLYFHRKENRKERMSKCWKN